MAVTVKNVALEDQDALDIDALAAKVEKNAKVEKDVKVEKDAKVRARKKSLLLQLPSHNKSRLKDNFDHLKNSSVSGFT